MRIGKHDRKDRQDGVVLLTVMVFILVMSLAAGAMVQLQSTQTRREKEQELLFVGDQYRTALRSYASRIVGAGARHPQTLEDLVNDNRGAITVHHLRRLYPDPMTGKPDWDLIMADNGIIGIKSKSNATPFKTNNFLPKDFEFQGKQSYSEWIFH